ncbi:YdaU family protein, partial [Shigella flexneri]
MAALPYMQLYIADYLADTMHLSAEEHGAYLLLMFNYWQTGKPIPKNRLAKIARLTNERWVDVEPSLREFFCDNGDEWMHLRIEEDLASVREKLTKKSAAGKASVQARRSRKEADVQTKQERNLTGVQTDVGVVFEHDAGFALIFPDICYHLTHYKPAAADIPVASDNP